MTDSLRLYGTLHARPASVLTKQGIAWHVLVLLFAISCIGNILPLAILPVAFLGLIFLGNLSTLHGLDSIAKLFLIIVLYSVFSAWLAGVPLRAFVTYEFLRNDAKFIFAYIPFLAAIVVQHSEKLLRETVGVWIWGAAIPVLAGALSPVLPWFDLGARLDYPLFRTSSAGINVFHGLFIAHTATGSFYALAFIFALHLAPTRRNSWIYYLAAIVIGAGLVMSLSRAFVVGVVCALALKVVIERRWKFLLAVTLAGAVLVAAIGGVLVDRLKQGDEDASAEVNTQVRLVLWERAIGYFVTSPLIGVGFSRFDDYPDNFRGVTGFVALKDSGTTLQTVDGDAEWSMEAHNNFLQILAEEGVVGMALWGLFWYQIFRRLRNRYRGLSPTSFQGAWVASCAYGSVAVLVASMFDINFWAPAVMLALGWALGAALSRTPWVPEQMANSNAIVTNIVPGSESFKESAAR